MPFSEEKKLEVPNSVVTAMFQAALQLTGDRKNAATVVYEACVGARQTSDLLNGGPGLRRELFRSLICATRRCNQGWPGLTRNRRTNRKARVVDPVFSALGRLPLSLREILLLVDCQEFSYRDAADILGVSLETVAEGVALGRTHLSLELPVREIQEKVGSA